MNLKSKINPKCWGKDRTCEWWWQTLFSSSCPFLVCGSFPYELFPWILQCLLFRCWHYTVWRRIVLFLAWRGFNHIWKSRWFHLLTFPVDAKRYLNLRIFLALDKLEHFCFEVAKLFNTITVRPKGLRKNYFWRATLLRICRAFLGTKGISFTYFYIKIKNSIIVIWIIIKENHSKL